MTLAQRAADVVTVFCGSWAFIFIFSGLTVGWIALNTVLVLAGEFDPYPFMERDREAVRGLHAKLDRLLNGTASTRPSTPTW